jgi:hypothetical protein
MSVSTRQEVNFSSSDVDLEERVMGTAVGLESWVDLDDIDVRYSVSAFDEKVEFYFSHRPTFTLVLTERAIARVLNSFPEALAELKTEIAERDETTPG